MKKDKNYWESAFDMFREDYPKLAEELNDWYPSGQMEITVRLSDGRKYAYDMFTRTAFLIPNVDRCEEVSEEDWRKHFARNLNRKMRNLGMSQETLSEIIGISQVMISKYLNGKSIPNIYNLHKIARALKCSATELTDVL